MDFKHTWQDINSTQCQREPQILRHITNTFTYSLSQIFRSKILKKSRNNQEHEEHSSNPSFTRIQLSSNWSNFFKSSQWFITESSSSNFRDCNSSTNLKIRTITVRRVRRREDRSESWTSEAERGRITDLFSVRDLPEASQDLIVRTSKQNQVNTQILLVLASNHHRRIKSESKRWIKVKTPKRFNKFETKP
jgi:hypothetical protein